METSVGLVDAGVEAAVNGAVGSPPAIPCHTIAPCSVGPAAVAEATLGRHLARRGCGGGNAEAAPRAAPRTGRRPRRLLCARRLQPDPPRSPPQRAQALPHRLLQRAQCGVRRRWVRRRDIGACVVTFTVGGLSMLNAIAGAYSENLIVIYIVGGPNTATTAPTASSTTRSGSPISPRSEPVPFCPSSPQPPILRSSPW